MKHVHFFQFNIPAPNHFIGLPDRYINVIAEWDGESFYKDGRPFVHTAPVNISFSELMQVKDWYTACAEIDECAEKHFAQIDRAQKLAEARAVLMQENEPTGVPTLDRFLSNVMIVEKAAI